MTEFNSSVVVTFLYIIPFIRKDGINALNLHSFRIVSVSKVEFGSSAKLFIHLQPRAVQASAGISCGPTVLLFFIFCSVSITSSLVIFSTLFLFALINF